MERTALSFSPMSEREQGPFPPRVRPTTHTAPRILVPSHSYWIITTVSVSVAAAETAVYIYTHGIFAIHLQVYDYMSDGSLALAMLAWSRVPSAPLMYMYTTYRSRLSPKLCFPPSHLQQVASEREGK